MGTDETSADDVVEGQISVDHDAQGRLRNVIVTIPLTDAKAITKAAFGAFNYAVKLGNEAGHADDWTLSFWLEAPETADVRAAHRFLSGKLVEHAGERRRQGLAVPELKVHLGTAAVRGDPSRTPDAAAYLAYRPTEIGTRGAVFGCMGLLGAAGCLGALVLAALGGLVGAVIGMACLAPAGFIGLVYAFHRWTVRQAGIELEKPNRWSLEEKDAIRVFRLEGHAPLHVLPLRGTVEAHAERWAARQGRGPITARLPLAILGPDQQPRRGVRLSSADERNVVEAFELPGGLAIFAVLPTGSGIPEREALLHVVATARGVPGAKPPVFPPEVDAVKLYFAGDVPDGTPAFVTSWTRAEAGSPEMTAAIAAAAGIYAAIHEAGAGDQALVLVSRHVTGARHVLAGDLKDEDREALIAWSGAVPCVALVGNTLCDGALRPLLGPDAHPTATPPGWNAAHDRRRRTDAGLVAAGLRKAPLSLPVVGEPVLRDAQQVALRAQALILVTMMAGMFQATGRVEDPAVLAERFGPLLDQLTPKERAFLAAPDAATAKEFGWRVEALAALAWALGWRDELPMGQRWENSFQVLIPHFGRTAAETATLRPEAQILDMLDAVYCRRWIVVDRLLAKAAVPSGLDPALLLERHHALAWLIQDQPWDEVTCST